MSGMGLGVTMRPSYDQSGSRKSLWGGPECRELFSSQMNKKVALEEIFLSLVIL